MIINKNEDIQIKVNFTDLDGNEIGVPSYDFELTYYVYGGGEIKASQIDGVLTNCSIVDDKLIIAIDAPTLTSGRLLSKRKLYVPNNYFPDGKQTIESEVTTNYTVL